MNRREESQIVKNWTEQDRTPLVTVLAICYCHEKYIRTALDSILAQETAFPFEVLVHDDASTDGSADIIREYAAAYPRIIRPILQSENQYSKGPEHILQALLPGIKGKYIAYLECDDYWTDPHKLQEQVDFLEEHPSFLAVAHNCTVVDRDGNPNGEEYPECKDPEYTREHFFNDILAGQLCTFVVRDILTKHPEDQHLFYKLPSGPFDRAFNLTLLFSGRVACIQKSMSAYRHVTRGGTSYSATYRFDLKREALYYHKLMLYCLKMGGIGDAIAMQQWIVGFIEHYVNLNVISQQEAAPYLDACRCSINTLTDRLQRKWRRCACCGEYVLYEALPIEAEEKRVICGNLFLPETLNRDAFTCPRCGSMDWERLAVAFLELLRLKEMTGGFRVLHLAPSPALERWLRANSPEGAYETCGPEMEGVDFHTDLQDMAAVSDKSYDLILCFHVLEHVQDDRKTFAELNRILKDDGCVLLLVPVDRAFSGIDEAWGLGEEENLRRFGRGDRCRHYSREGLLARLKERFSVQILGKSFFGEDVFRQAGLSDSSTLYILHKAGWVPELLDTALSVQRARSEANARDQRCTVEAMQMQAAELGIRTEQLRQNEQTLRDRDERIASLEQALSDRDKNIAQLEQTVRNMEGHIELLLESDRELERIHNARYWKLLCIWWRFRDFLFPQNTKRRLYLKVMKKFLFHPIWFLKRLDMEHVRRFFNGVRSGSISSINDRLDNYLGGSARQVDKPMPIPVNEYLQLSDVPPLHVPSSDKPLVSIIIPVYNQFDYTYACLKSIAKNNGDVSYEVIVADDGSTDLTTGLSSCVTGIRVLRNRENLRFLKNCNHAAEYAKGKYILFLNNDTQVQKDWLAPLVKLIESADDVGMVGSKLVYPDGRLQEAGGIVWKDGSAWNYGHGSDPSLPQFNYVKEVDYISGASIMIRRALWEEIGGFDERFAPAYYEDTDLAFSVRRRGYRVMFQPLSVVVHFEGVSNGTDTSTGLKAYQIENQKKFLEKWRDVLEAEHNPNAVNPFLARERGFGKKVLLMADHYVPQFDKDAGSRCVFQYLRLFVSEGYHVKFIGDNFYPHQPYTTVLQQMGIEVLYGPHYANHWKDWLRENGQSIRYAFLNRPHIAVKYIDEVRKYTPARIVYFGHDLHFLREYREYKVTGDESFLKSSGEWKNKEFSLMRKADMAYYPSSVEVDEVHRVDAGVQVKAIPLFIYDGIEKNGYDPDKRADLMLVGGFGHRPNVDAVKWLSSEIMPTLERLLPEARVFILGSNPPAEILALHSERFQIVGYVTDEELARYYQSCRMAIVPLRYGAGIKGKVVEAMRYGLPLVTTSIGAEGIPDAEANMGIADEGEAFAKLTAALYQDRERLLKMSEDSFRCVRECFSPESAKNAIRAEFDME